MVSQLRVKKSTFKNFGRNGVIFQKNDIFSNLLVTNFETSRPNFIKQKPNRPNFNRFLTVSVLCMCVNELQGIIAPSCMILTLGANEHFFLGQRTALMIVVRRAS